jgi:predicted transcriptional regulator
MPSEDQKPSVLDLTAEIVSSFVSNNHVNVAGLEALIGSVHGALLRSMEGEPATAEPEPQKPAVAIKKSVTPDYIICLEDGRQFKSLKRHLSAKFGMTPDEYRAKWGLPKDYPMVAPAYSQSRSDLAVKLGLGRKPAAEPAAKPAKAKRPARKKAAAAA